MSKPHTSHSGRGRAGRSRSATRFRAALCGLRFDFLPKPCRFAALLLATQSAVLSPGTVQGATPPAYLWPIEAPHQLTSSFGEYRRGHFHGGVDFSTGRRVGLPVYAVADGRVWRVRASGSGYGRALYVRLADGRTAVYAHLDAFNPEIDAYVAAAQESLSRYEVDLHPEPHRLPVAAGDMLGRTGESGAGPPHLHFEIREGEGADRGVDPLGLGYAVADTTPPVIRAVKFRPHGAGAAAGGRADPAIVAAEDLGGGRYRLPPVSIAGAALLSVEAWDPAGTGNRLAPRSATIECDGTTLYTIRLERFDWDSAHEVELAFDAERARSGASFFMNLYRPEGARDPAFGDAPPLAGRIEPAPAGPGPRAITIRVRDAAGNEARLDGSVDAGPAGPGGAADPPNVFRVARGRAIVLRSGRLTLSAPERAFFGPGRIAVREAAVTAGEGSGLAIAGGGVAIDAPDLVLDRAVRVALAPDGAAAGAGPGLYRVSGPDAFAWVGDAAGEDGIGGDTRMPGTFVLARDVSPPRIRIERPGEGGAGTARPEIRVALGDRGSGFGWSDITTEIDGVPQIVVYDPESGILSGRSRRPLAPGPHTLAVTVRDRAGNVSRETRTFTVAG